MKVNTLIISILLVAGMAMQAQEWRCPQRVAKGDPIPTQRVEPHKVSMGTPGIGNLNLPPRVPVIMVNFKNYAFSTTKAHADSLFNALTPMQTDLGTRVYSHQVITHGSVANYFNDQSLGQYRPRFDVVGPVTLSKDYAYYGSNASGSASAMIKEACTLVNDSVDFSQYDSDQDGYIDLVFVFFAGFGENDGNYIDKGFGVSVDDLVWPHYSTTSGGPYDGKYLRAYECSNEIDGYLSQPSCVVPAGSGVLVHEYSHGMGLPDIYAKIGGSQTQFMGTWDLMDYGCYNAETFVPAPYTGYERWFCGWSQPHWLNSAMDVTLRPISESGEFGIITATGAPLSKANADTTYWVIENHQKKGWDLYAQGEGLIVYQIKHHSGWGSSANGNSTHDGYILLPADDTLRVGGYVGRQANCYPYREKDSIVLPKASMFPITNIQVETNGDISFQVCGGQPTGLEARWREGEETRWLNGEKVMIDGRIYIHRGNKLYTLTGNETHLL